MHRRAWRRADGAGGDHAIDHLPRRRRDSGAVPARARRRDLAVLASGATLSPENPMSSVFNPDAAARRRVFFVFVSQGLAGLSVMLWLTAVAHTETLAILNKLGPNAAIL